MRTCPICNHEHREDIESILLRLTPDNSKEVIEYVVTHFDIDETSIKEHCMFHSSFLGTENESIVRQIKMREADMLEMLAVDQLNTVKTIGKRIRSYTSSDDALYLEKALTKQTVDLYLGAGDGLRRNVQAIADINQLLNGPKDDGLSGLTALASVLKESRERRDDSE